MGYGLAHAIVAWWHALVGVVGCMGAWACVCCCCCWMAKRIDDDVIVGSSTRLFDYLFDDYLSGD